MERVRLFHWNHDDGSAIVDLLRNAGYQVDYDANYTHQLFRLVRESPPDAIIIDLSRLPSHGRELATGLRGDKRTRHVPILFLDGAAEKVDIVRKNLPDAAYCERPRLLAALRKCIRERLQNPVVPTQMMQRYAGRTTAQKLGIAAGSRVAVVDPPRDYLRVIGTLPDGVEFDEESSAGAALTIWFVQEPEALLAALPKMRRVASKSKLWIAWPKKSARKDSPLNEKLIREMAIESGLVDYKVCSVNETWSGLCFAIKKDGI